MLVAENTVTDYSNEGECILGGTCGASQKGSIRKDLQNLDHQSGDLGEGSRKWALLPEIQQKCVYCQETEFSLTGYLHNFYLEGGRNNGKLNL